jgi:hypothetical protein
VTILTPVISTSVTLPYGNCFELAARYLGDATQVDRIMRLNPQLNGDPWFVGPTTVLIPRIAPGTGSGGVIGL